MNLKGSLNLLGTAGKFSILINENRQVFKKYFGVDLYPGSVNVYVNDPGTLQADMDKGVYLPDFVIPRTELVDMPDYIGDGQAWACILSCNKLETPINCWVFRRIGSRVPKGVIELVAQDRLVIPNNLKNGDDLTLRLPNLK